MSIQSAKGRAPASGEEFRDDVRKKLPAEVLAPLTELSPLRSTLAVLQTFGLIALVIVLAVKFWSIPTAIVADRVDRPAAACVVHPCA